MHFISDCLFQLTVRIGAILSYLFFQIKFCGLYLVRFSQGQKNLLLFLSENEKKATGPANHLHFF